MGNVLYTGEVSHSGLLKTYQLIAPYSCLGDFRLSLEETKRLHSLHSGGRCTLNMRVQLLCFKFFVLCAGNEVVLSPPN